MRQQSRSRGWTRSASSTPLAGWPLAPVASMPGEDDVLLAAEDVREDRVDEQAGVAEHAAFASLSVACGLGKLRGLVVAVERLAAFENSKVVLPFWVVLGKDPVRLSSAVALPTAPW